MTLPALEFIRRFLQHVLPQGFVKVRYYGFLSSTHRQSFQTLRTILSVDHTPEPSPPPRVDENQPTDSPTALGCPRCPHCGRIMQLVQTLAPLPRGTPMNHGLIPSRLNSRSPAGKKLQQSRHGRFLSLSCPSQSKLGSRPLPNPSEPSTSAFPKPRIAFLGPLTQFAPQHFT